MEERPQGPRALGLGDLVNETFVIYGRHLREVLSLVAAVQVPLALISGLALRQNTAATVALGVAASAVLYGALTFAVCQHYTGGRVEVGVCFRRVWWRIVSLTLVALVLGAMLAAVGAAFLMPDERVAASVILGLGIPVTIVSVYLSFAIPVVVVEGRKAGPALARSWALVRDSWWRVVGFTLVLWLISFGLSLVVGLPFGLLAEALGGGGALAMAIDVVGAVIAGVVAPPAFFIGAALLYLDLRVKKEGLNLRRLSMEMGLAPERALEDASTL